MAECTRLHVPARAIVLFLASVVCLADGGPSPQFADLLAGAKTDLERASKLYAAAQAVKDDLQRQSEYLKAAAEYALKSAASRVPPKMAEESLDLAEKCLRELMGKAPAEKPAWTHKEAEVHRLRYRRAREPAEKEATGAKLVGALLAVGAFCEKDGAWKDAAGVYREANDVASSLRLETRKETSDRLALALHRTRAAETVARCVGALKDRPDDARLRVDLVRALVVDLDDPAEAAKHVTPEVGEPWRTCVPLAGRPMSEATKTVCKELGDWYFRELAKLGESNSGVEESMVSRAKSYYDMFLKLPPANAPGAVDVSVALTEVNTRLRRLAIRGTFLEEATGSRSGPFEVPENLTWKRVGSSGRVWGGFKLVNVTKGHDEKAVLKFIAEGDLSKEAGGRKLEVATPDGDNVLEGGGDHENATYYVFYLGTNVPQDIVLDLKYAQFGEARAYLDFRLIADIPHNAKSDTRIPIHAKLPRGKHALVIRYINGWAARWLSLRILGKGVYLGVLSPDGPAGMIDTHCDEP